MSDEVRIQISAIAKALCHYPSGPSATNSCCPGIGRCEMNAAITEIARLRAETQSYLSAYMKAAGEFHTMQCRIARQRRALAKMYKHRHDKNAEIALLYAAIATARREGMEEAAQWHDKQAAQAQKLSDMKVSALDAKVWGDYATNHREYATAIRAAAQEGKP